MKTPVLIWVPPDVRLLMTNVDVPFITCSRLSPSTQRQSVPIVRKFQDPSGREYCTIPPVSFVGTRCMSVRRLPLRDPGGCRPWKLLWNVSKLPQARAWRSPLSAKRTRTPPLIDFQYVLLSSEGTMIPKLVGPLALMRSSEKYPPRTNVVMRSVGLKSSLTLMLS